MKTKKSTLLAIASGIFLLIGIYLLASSKGIAETPEMNPHEGVSFMIIAFIVSAILAAIYARKNL